MSDLLLYGLIFFAGFWCGAAVVLRSLKRHMGARGTALDRIGQLLCYEADIKILRRKPGDAKGEGE